MDKGQLNFNQPLLSVRRGSSTTAPPEVNKRSNSSRSSLPPLPYYKSELKSGPVRNPGVVPFQWEQMPGRPKNENYARRNIIEQLPLAPKLPPGRIAILKQKSLDNSLIDSPTSSTRSQSENKIPSDLDNSSVDQVLSEFEASEKGTERKDSFSSDDGNETYVDARDTLSRTESFFNCSISGVSGLDDPNIALTGAFSDPQTRDFMMGRFLPAAKAVASETPQYASRKHPSTKEQPRLVKREIKWKRQLPQNKSADTGSHNIHGESEDEDADEESLCDATEDMSAKLCGLLPRFCLLNPIPGMRDHAQAISSVRSVRTRPAYAASCRTEKKDEKIKYRGELKRVPTKYASANEPSIDVNLDSESQQSCGNGPSRSFLNVERGFLNLPKQCRVLEASKVDLQNSGGAKLKELPRQLDANPAIEKTLYMDTDRVEQCRKSNSSSSESRGRNPSVDSLQDIGSLCGAEEKPMCQSKSSDAADSSVVSTPKSCQDIKEDMVKDSQKDRNLNLVVNVMQRPKTDVTDTVQNGSHVLIMSPLLPKSPSESWLSRTLPLMPSKNPSSKSCLGNLAFRSSPMDSRRDRMLKSTNVQQKFFQPAGELAPIMEN